MAQDRIPDLPDITTSGRRVRTEEREPTLKGASCDTRAATYTPEERLAPARRLQSRTPPGLRNDPAEFIREDRDR